MADLSGIHIGKQARALAASLVLGAAILSLSPGYPAHAAIMTPEAGDVDDGAGETGSGSAAREKPRPKGGGKQCTYKESNGTTSTYKPGEVITVVGTITGKFRCGEDGKWHQQREGGPVEYEGPSGGVYAPAP